MLARPRNRAIAIVLGTTASLVLFPFPAASISEPSADLEVLCEFTPGTVILATKQLSAPVEDAISPTTAAFGILRSFGVLEVARAFPDFRLADTLAVARTGEVVHQTDWSRVFKLRVSDTSTRQELCRALRESRNVLFADPNGYGVGCAAPIYPNDTLFVDRTQWGVWNSGQSGGKFDADVDGPEGWGYTTGSSGHRIAIVDGGFDGTHQELFGRALGTAPQDTISHGFQVACVAGANADNSIGIAGVDWHADLVSLLGGYQKSDPLTIQALGDSWNVYHAQVVNNSWVLTDAAGQPRFSNSVREAFADAYKRNQVAVCAMGNGGDSVLQYPAAFGQGIIAVGATTRRDSIWVPSSRGSHMDVCAPGHEIVSCTSDGGFRTESGTSFAAPIVSGLASLLIARNPSLYNDDVENLIKLGADDLGAPGFDPLYGMGRVNLRRSLQLLDFPNRFAQGADSGFGVYIPPGGSGIYYGKEVLGVPGVVDSFYDVKWYKVQKRIGFNAGFISAPRVWGRGVRSKGYAFDQILVGMGWCGVEAGSITPDSCTLSTFVYEIPQGSNNFYPVVPANAVFGWSALQMAPVADTLNSYFVPQAVVSGSVVEGTNATQFFRTCPNLDGIQILKNKARIMVVAKDSGGNGIPGIAATDIFVLLNGGSAAQGFVGEAADSIASDPRWTPSALCPRLRAIQADSATDQSGTAYITFIGAGGQRDTTRKWGGYDSDMPVYVLGTKILGKVTSTSPLGTYRLQIRNVDFAGSLLALPDKPEIVNSIDNNYYLGHPTDYWFDFDGNGTVNNLDINFFKAHLSPPHTCRFPNNP